MGTPNQVSLGQLWLELLKFYTLDFALEEYVICVRIQDILTRENKNWPKRRIAIEGEMMYFIWRMFLCATSSFVSTVVLKIIYLGFVELYLPLGCHYTCQVNSLSSPC